MLSLLLLSGLVKKKKMIMTALNVGLGMDCAGNCKCQTAMRILRATSVGSSVLHILSPHDHVTAIIKFSDYSQESGQVQTSSALQPTKI